MEWKQIKCTKQLLSKNWYQRNTQPIRLCAVATNLHNGWINPYIKEAEGKLQSCEWWFDTSQVVEKRQPLLQDEFSGPCEENILRRQLSMEQVQSNLSPKTRQEELQRTIVIPPDSNIQLCWEDRIKTIEAKIRCYFQVQNLLNEEQEGFQLHKSSVRSTYSLKSKTQMVKTEW